MYSDDSLHLQKLPTTVKTCSISDIPVTYWLALNAEEHDNGPLLDNGDGYDIIVFWLCNTPETTLQCSYRWCCPWATYGIYKLEGTEIRCK